MGGELVLVFLAWLQEVVVVRCTYGEVAIGTAAACEGFSNLMADGVV